MMLTQVGGEGETGGQEGGSEAGFEVGVLSLPDRHVEYEQYHFIDVTTLRNRHEFQALRAFRTGKEPFSMPKGERGIIT